MKNRLLSLVEDAQIRATKAYTVKDDKSEEKRTVTRELAEFQIGDTIDVHQRILEGTKERNQVFTGTVIGRHGSGLNETFTVRKVVQGEGVERVFPINSPKIAKIEVRRTGTVRRAKLYFLRDRVGKATRLRERKVKETPATPSANGESAPTASGQKPAKKTTKSQK
jgi:large subunit ribosomal protein L19